MNEEDNLNWINEAEKDQKRFMRRYKREWKNLGVL